MRTLKRLSAAVLGLLPLAGCQNTQAADFTPVPYAYEDGAFEYFWKTLVNLPAWTGEGIVLVSAGALVAGFFLGILWIQAGAPGVSGGR